MPLIIENGLKSERTEVKR